MTVAAASDFLPVEQELSTRFGKVCECKLIFVNGSSGMLAQQIRNGAPFDVYLSANEQYVKDMEASGHLLKASGRVYAIGRLGLWSKNRSRRRLEDLPGASVTHVAIANPVHAPYGVAARQMLQRLKLWATMAPRIVYAENVRQALQFAESGNAEAAIVAWSLVHNRGGVLLPAELHDPIRQAGAVVRSSHQPALARRLLDFLTSPDGARLLERFGFFAAPEDPR